MNEFLIVLGFATLPALGNVLGALLAEVLPLSQRLLSLALHFAAGIILAVVGTELMAQVLAATPVWPPLLALVAGGGFTVLLDSGLRFIRARTGSAQRAGPWLIYIGVAVDLFSDGILIGTGSTIGLGLGLLLALGQVPADLPEGFAVGAAFREQRVTRRRRLLLALSFAVPIFLGTTIGYWAVRGQPDLAKQFLTVAVEEVLTEAHEGSGTSPWDTLALVGGFALFALLSASAEAA